MQYIIFWLHFVAGCFCFILSLIVWFYYIIHPEIRASSSKSIRFWSVIAIIMYCLTCFSLSYRMRLLDSDDQPSTAKEWYIGYAVFASWRIAQSMTYIIFIQRLKKTFKNTKYASTACTYNVLYVISVLFIVPELGKDAINKYPNPSQETKDLIIVTEFIISMLIDLYLSIVLLYLFLRKLYSLNLDIALLNRMESNNVYLKEKYMKLNDIMAKICILTVWSLASTQILMTLFCIVFFMHNKGYSMLIVSQIWMICWSIDCCINCLCIFWSFDFAVSYYFYACSKCHKHCVKCCKNRGIYKFQHVSYKQIEGDDILDEQNASINDAEIDRFIMHVGNIKK